MKDLGARPLRYLITPGKATTRNFEHVRTEILDTVRNACGSGIELIQVREKLLTGRTLTGLVREIVDISRGADTRILVNERFDIALAAGAHGVHLTSTSLPLERVRQVVPSKFIIGVSVHTEDEAIESQKNGADFAMYGPVFSTPGKAEPVGAAVLARVCRKVESFPIIAVGGINASNIDEVISAGAAGYASIRYLNEINI